MSTIKTNIIEPLGTAITISGAAHFTSGNAVLGGLTATNQINANGGLSVTGGATVYGDIEVYDGAFVRSGGLSVTGGASITGNIRVNASTLSIVGVAPSYTARAWASFDEAGTILNSGNVSSVSNPSFSNFTVNFSTAMPTAGYGVTISHTSSPGTSNRVQFVILNGEPLTTSVSIKGGQVESNTLASTFEADRTTVSIIGH